MRKEGEEEVMKEEEEEVLKEERKEEMQMLWRTNPLHPRTLVERR